MATPKKVAKKVAIKKPTKTPVDSTATSQSRGDRSHVLVGARITEKATLLNRQNTYTFDVATSATKRDVIMAVRDVYKVVPTQVHMVKVVDKTVRSRRSGTLGVKRGGKKAYVTLKKDETITI